MIQVDYINTLLLTLYMYYTYLGDLKMQHTLLRNAEVTATASYDASNHPIANININDQYEYTFDRNSRISKALGIMSEAELTHRLSGGQYFMVDDQLIDFRDGNYNGFVHTDESIGHLVDTIGMTEKKHERIAVVHKNTFGDIALGAKWSDHEITIPEYDKGGMYTSELHFAWNPFVKTVNSAFMLYRLICTNGMMGMRSFLNTKIPLVNRWEEHLEIANMQIQNKVNTMVTQRLGQMGDERATLAEVILLANHAQKRLKANNESNADRLHSIVNIVSPEMHLRDVYRDEAFTNINVANQLPSHLTTYDVYNMTTEVRTHTNEVTSSTVAALDKLANGLIFDRKANPNTSIGTGQAPSLHMFSDPDRAFFGDLAEAA